MSDKSTDNRHESDNSFDGDDTEVPLWLLQHDDTPRLYLSFLASGVLHVALFFVLAATRIFHPFAGPSVQFDLVWLAPAQESSKKAVQKTGDSNIEQSAKMAGPSAKRATPIQTTPRQAPTQVKQAEPEQLTSPQEKFTPETEGEKAVTRFGGKVVEVVEKTEAPTFIIASSVRLRSETHKAVVRTIQETVDKPEQPARIAKTVEKRQPLEPSTSVKSTIANSIPEKQKPAMPAGEKAPATPAAKAAVLETPVHQPISSSGYIVVPAAKTVSSPGREAVIPPTASTGSVPAMEKVQQGTAIGVPQPGSSQATSKERFAAASQPRERQPQQPPVVAMPKAEPAKGTPAPQEPPKPRMIFHPPIFGDLKLVITTPADIKTDATFREFRKNRRHKPLTIIEARNRREVILKFIKVKEHVSEAVLESSEEGIYELAVQSADGSPVTASILLKVHDFGLGGKTINLGKRTISGRILLVRILMPEGILWDDNTCFTGDMEDSDSVTKFNAETGLVWKEYK